MSRLRFTASRFVCQSALLVVPLTLCGCDGDTGASASRAGGGAGPIDGPAHVEVGDAARGSDQPFEFTVVNTLDDQPLQITRVASSCGCTSVAIDRTEIGPGKTATVTGVIAAPELSTGSARASSAVSLLGASGKPIFSTQVTVRSVDALDAGQALWAGGEVRIPIRSLYNPGDYSWAVYRKQDDSPLAHRIEREGPSAVLVVEHGAPEAPPEFVVVMKETGVRGLRLAQTLSPAVQKHSGGSP